MPRGRHGEIGATSSQRRKPYTPCRLIAIRAGDAARFDKVVYAAPDPAPPCRVIAAKPAAVPARGELEPEHARAETDGFKQTLSHSYAVCERCRVQVRRYNGLALKQMVYLSV